MSKTIEEEIRKHAKTSLWIYNEAYYPSWKTEMNRRWVPESIVLGVLAKTEAQWKERMTDQAEQHHNCVMETIRKHEKAEAERNQKLTDILKVIQRKANALDHMMGMEAQTKFLQATVRELEALLGAGGNPLPPKTETSVTHGVGIGGGQHNDVQDKKETPS